MGQVGSQSICGNCGTVNAAGEQFCVNCGYSLAGGPTGPSFSGPTIVSSTAPSAISSGTPTLIGPNAPTIGGSGIRRTTGALIAGNLLESRYRVVRLVGKGGFGAVYEARDERFQAKRIVAIKEMSDGHLTPAERAQAIADFRQEADLLVQLKHPNLPDVSDFFEEGGKAYLVMEYIEGKTLEKEQEDAGGPLDENRVMGWALQLCDVLGYLHTQPQPIVFRDMKPSNVMITKSGQIKLIDFGIARIFKSTAAKDTTSLGSRGYAPLEQYGRGQSDARSDIYALGATLFDLLTKEVPADAPTRRINPQLFQTPRQLNPHISQAAENIVLKAMEQEPRDRFQSTAEMAQAIIATGLASNVGAYFGNTSSHLNTQATSAPTLAQTIPTSPPAAPGAPGSAGSPFMSAPPTTYPAGQSPLNVGAGLAPAQLTPAQQPPPSGPRISRRALLGLGAAGAVAVATGVYFFSRSGGTSNSPANTITLNFTYSTEKSTWMQAVADTFHSKGISYNNKSIQVVLDERGSVDGQARILSGEINPAAWSPASFLELNQLSANWQQQHNGADIIINNGDLLPKSLVFSPLVFAIWADRARVLLDKYGKIDWPAVHSAVTLKNGWSDIGGNPAWQLVKFGQTRPDQSNSGLLTITLLAYAANNEQRNLTVDQLNTAQFKQYFKDIEDAVNAFGRSSGTFLQNVVIQQGPAQYDIVTTYENLVLTLENQAISRQHQQLQLFYPGVNILSDHPFAILQAKGVTNEQRMAARVFREFLLATEQQKVALSSGFRPTNPNVQVTDNVPGNVFRGQPAGITISPQLQSLAQAPSGVAINKLLQVWTDQYGTSATTPGG
jgi:serine/threonine protein kinase